MGRITVFTVKGCPYCKVVTNALTEHNLPYVEISLTTYPERRKEVVQLTQRTSIPQVFFNTRHIGGADETLAVLKNWDTDKKRYTSARNRYDREIGSQPDPGNKVFRIPTVTTTTTTTTTTTMSSTSFPSSTSSSSSSSLSSSSSSHRINTIGKSIQDSFPTTPAIPQPNPLLKRERTHVISLPNAGKGEEKLTIVDITELLKAILPISDLKYGISTYKMCFKGSDATQAFQRHFNISKEEAIKFGEELHSANILHHVMNEHGFKNSDKLYFRLHCHQTPDVLNSYRIWKKTLQVDAMELVSHLSCLLSEVEYDMTATADATVDYKNAHKHEKYLEFEEAVCGLQSVALEQFNPKQLFVFGLNLYMVMMKYSFMKVGIATTEISRLSQLNSVKFNVGGHVFSLQDWYNGVLRGNRRVPNSCPTSSGLPFGKKDPRRQFALPFVDYRIHFALNNMSSRWCSPISSFTVENVDRELDIVANLFCEDDGNVQIDPKSGQVQLSEIFRWYRVDFSTTNTKNSTAKKEAVATSATGTTSSTGVVDNNELLSVIMNHVPTTKQSQLRRILFSSKHGGLGGSSKKKQSTIAFRAVNWSSNAKEFVPFDRRSITPRIKIFQKIRS